MLKECAITFHYYDDILAVAPFYEETLGFELVLDQGMARIYRIVGTAYFGIVDGTKGHMRTRPHSASLLTIVSEDVVGWHRRLGDAGVIGQTGILRGNYCEHFFFEDPGGYAIEIQRFHDPKVAQLLKCPARRSSPSLTAGVSGTRTVSCRGSRASPMRTARQRACAGWTDRKLPVHRNISPPSRWSHCTARSSSTRPRAAASRRSRPSSAAALGRRRTG